MKEICRLLQSLLQTICVWLLTIQKNFSVLRTWRLKTGSWVDFPARVTQNQIQAMHKNIIQGDRWSKLLSAYPIFRPSSKIRNSDDIKDFFFNFINDSEREAVYKATAGVFRTPHNIPRHFQIPVQRLHENGTSFPIFFPNFSKDLVSGNQFYLPIFKLRNPFFCLQCP